MKLINLALGAGFLFGSLSASSSTSATTTSTSTSTTTTSTTSSSTTSVYTTSSLTYSTYTSASTAVALPTQLYSINLERPRMINQINIQRSGMKHPLLCQDSLLTSIAQQHANDMAAIDTLEHDLPCSSTAYPVQFCSSKKRLSPFGQAAENIAYLVGNDGSASMAMGKFNADAGQFSNMMNPDYLYIGVGMAMNPISGKYYWVQVFSTGNYHGVSCTLEPSVTVLDAFNRTSTTVQPALNLDMKVHPQGITNNNNKNGLYCTMIPYAHGTGTSVLPLGELPYPTITMVPLNVTSGLNNQITGIVGAFAAALSQANATIIGPSSIKYVPMQVQTTTSISFNTTRLTSTSLVNPASMLATFTPTNSAQSSAQAAMSSMLKDPAMSSLLANPAMSSAAAQMAQIMMLASVTSTSTSSSTTSALSTSTK